MSWGLENPATSPIYLWANLVPTTILHTGHAGRMTGGYCRTTQTRIAVNSLCSLPLRKGVNSHTVFYLSLLWQNQRNAINSCQESILISKINLLEIRLKCYYWLNLDKVTNHRGYGAGVYFPDMVFVGGRLPVMAERPHRPSEKGRESRCDL